MTTEENLRDQIAWHLVPHLIPQACKYPFTDVNVMETVVHSAYAWADVVLRVRDEAEKETPR